jgi:hypothetical protein
VCGEAKVGFGSWRQMIAGGWGREGKSPKGDVMERWRFIFHVIKLSDVG